MKNLSLRERASHALVVLGLAGLALGTAACDTNGDGMFLITTASPANAAVTISPNLIGVTSLPGFGCTGLAFGSSFDVIVVASGQDLTVDSMMLHMIDGTNLGGPSVTIPSSQLNAQFGTTIVRAGTSRAFPVQPRFGCSERRPHSLGATVFVKDPHGRQQSLMTTVAVR